MSSEVISCPSCRNSVRVPDSLLGQSVRCPSCKAYFTAPMRDAEGRIGKAKLLSEPPTVESAREPVDWERQPVKNARTLFVPGIILLLIGIVGPLAIGRGAYLAISDPEQVKNQAFQTQEEFHKQLKIEFHEKEAKEFAGWAPAIIVVAFVVSVLPLFGGISMLTTRFYPVAILGSLAAMIDLVFCMCLIGAPVGIYCLIKLFDPEIRALFRRS
jgi:predicted Zn finger-like uncharacterized protein